MKIILFLLCFLPILQCYGQDPVSTNNDEEKSYMTLSVYQDLRLLFIGDDLGNSAFTPDIIIRLEIEAITLKNGSSFQFNLGAEYADLNSSSLQRVLIGFGYRTSFPFIKKFVFEASIDHGLLLRGKNSFIGDVEIDENSFMGFSANLETTYPIRDNIRLSLMLQAIDRKDLSLRFKTGSTIRYSVLFGAKFAL